MTSNPLSRVVEDLELPGAVNQDPPCLPHVERAADDLALRRSQGQLDRPLRRAEMRPADLLGEPDPEGTRIVGRRLHRRAAVEVSQDPLVAPPLLRQAIRAPLRQAEAVPVSGSVEREGRGRRAGGGRQEGHGRRRQEHGQDPAHHASWPHDELGDGEILSEGEGLGLGIGSMVSVKSASLAFPDPFQARSFTVYVPGGTAWPDRSYPSHVVE